MSDTVQKAGRIEYIEPNSLFTMSEDDKVQNGIPQPYEDYSFSVNLRVINGNRYDCGQGGNDGRNVLEYSSDHGTLSFMDGTVNNGQAYLTTNFTDISMNDPSTNTKECLGIERISIRYDSWYYPTVDIKFVDVRGASLMQPSEYEYYNNGGPNIGKPGKGVPTSHSDFFRAFFSFPYPLFKLSVKGFYGKEVTYDLSVLKCNIELNSSTGNFEMNASFIGYMYGMYADMPFSFIYLAPYINLNGKNTWDEKKGTGDFRYLSPGNDTMPGTKSRPVISTEMYTFPELREKVKNVSVAAEKKLEVTAEGVRRKSLETLIKKLENDVLFRYPTLKGKYLWKPYSNNTKKDGYYYLVTDKTGKMKGEIFNDFLNFCRGYREYVDLVDAESKKVENTKSSNGQKASFSSNPNITEKEFFTNFNNAVTAIKNDPARKEKLILSDYTTKEIEKVLDSTFTTLVFNKTGEGKNATLNFNRESSSINGGDDFSDLITELITNFNNNEVGSPMSRDSYEKEWHVIAFKMDTGYYDSIDETLKAMKKEYDALLKLIDEKRDEEVIKLVGFSPYIKNAFNMIFAHVDTFMSVFFNVLDNIRTKIQSTDDSRKKEKVLSGNGGSTIQVDVSDATLAGRASNGGKLPPFTMFYQEQEKKDSKDREIVMLWPGNIEGAKDFDEVKLVEEIINATSLSRRRFNTVTPGDNIVRKEGILAPINYYDLVSDNWNPYLDILDDKGLGSSDTPKRLVEVFMLRCFYSMLSGSYTNTGDNEERTSAGNFTKKAKLIASIEVENIKRALEIQKSSTPKDVFIKGLNMLSTDGAKFISEYIGNDSGMFASQGNGEDLFYKWIKKGGYYSLPVGVFSSGDLAEYRKKYEESGENYDKFLKISTNGNTDINGNYACRIYSGGKMIEKKLRKYTSGDFVDAAKLFPNFNKLPRTLSKIGFSSGTFMYDSPREETNVGELYENIGNELSFNGFLRSPSVRKTNNGTTNIFMDPLYYAQKSPEARAYMFLMGVQYDNGKNLIFPDSVENGDYPTLLLLREGAIQWRANSIVMNNYGDSTSYTFVNDPITYEYTVNGVTKNALDDIERNDPRFGRTAITDIYKNGLNGETNGRNDVLVKYFVKWADGIDAEYNPDAVIPSVTEKSKFEVKLPDAKVSFPEIETYLALWEENGSTKQILSRDNCYLAFSADTVSRFANSEILKNVYVVNEDGTFGKRGNNIRTDVYLRKPGSENAPESVSKFQDAFKKFYVGFDTIIDFSCLDRENKTMTVPANAMTGAISAFIDGLKKTYSQANTKNTSKEYEEEQPVQFKQFKDDDFKLACYIALKNMYDRWLCNSRRENWLFSCKDTESIKAELKGKIKSDFERFFYINEFYQDIGLTIPVNLTQFSDTMCSLGGFTEKTNENNLASCSLMKALSTTAQFAGCALLTLPTKLGLSKTYSDTNNSIADVFKAFPYNEAVKTNSMETSFIVLYSNQKSSVLDNEDDKGLMGYKNDGFDIANTWGKITDVPPMFSDNVDGGYVVPCFGVTFAKQNQSYFKDIRLSMDDHQITEYSIKNELMISYESNKGPKESVILGQDLYSVFSNYSYSCSVSMLGDAQITPLMYFQLNNVPMWKGAYMITNVQHDITIGGMDTRFTGVRQSRPSLPTKENKTANAADSASLSTPESQEETHPATGGTAYSNEPLRPLDKIDVSNAKTITFIIERLNLKDNNKFVSGRFSVHVLLGDNSVEEYKNVAQTIEPVYGLSEQIENMGTKDGIIENIFFPVNNTVMFCLPAGRYSNVMLENASAAEEYRNDNDDFYTFTNKQHITVSDSKYLRNKRCEIITGETSYDEFESGKLSNISIGGIAPIMIYPITGQVLSKQVDINETRAVYKEIFNLVKRAMEEPKKSITLLIKEAADIQDNKS